MKWVGALTITAVCYFIGVLLAKNESDKIKSIESLLSLISYMKRRITAERAPIYEIFSSFSDGFLEERGFLPILRAHRLGTPLLWEDALKTIPVSAEARLELIRFGNELGTLTFEAQLKRIDSLKEFLDSERNDLKQTLPKKQKSLKTVWLLSGLLISIILL